MFGPKMFKTPKKMTLFMQYRLTNVPSLSNHCCQVCFRMSNRGMHRSLAKQDMLLANVISYILPVNEIPRSCSSLTNP